MEPFAANSNLNDHAKNAASQQYQQVAVRRHDLVARYRLTYIADIGKTHRSADVGKHFDEQP
jgi:hypothetical protein